MKQVVPFIALLILAGCAAQPETPPSTSVKDSDVTESSKPVTQAATWPSDVKIHKSAEGKVTCPVMKSTIDSPDKAVGYQDYKGVRYYFCCDMCPDKFKENPALYAEKADQPQKPTGEG